MHRPAQGCEIVRCPKAKERRRICNFSGISEAGLSFFLQGGLAGGPGKEMERKRSWLT